MSGGAESEREAAARCSFIITLPTSWRACYPGWHASGPGTGRSIQEAEDGGAEIVKLNVLPTPGVLVAQILPPCASTMHFEM